MTRFRTSEYFFFKVTDRPDRLLIDVLMVRIYSWLFPQIDAALHHGGAGTTGASLRGESLPIFRPIPLKSTHILTCTITAGIPTLIKPWFGDQFFWASRVHKLGVRLTYTHLHISNDANLWILVTGGTESVQSARERACGRLDAGDDG